jgi:16S rRNA (guanine527-N7)-methyltransferase
MAEGATGLFLKGEAADAELEEARRAWMFRAEITPSVSDPRGRLIRIEGLAARAG